jgi:hypothetical protein
MRLLILALVFSCGLSAQYARRNVVTTTKAQDGTKGFIVTFEGKLTEFTKKDLTIETEDQPAVVIGVSHKTKFLKDGKTIKMNDLPVGAALSVDVVKDPDLHLLAVTVNVELPGAKPAEVQK